MNENPGTARSVANVHGNGHEAESTADVDNELLTAEREKPSAGPEQGTEQAKERAEERAEFGGPKGPEPTRYGDWERNGRCYDF